MEAIDLLFLTIAACVAILTLFISITLVYLLFILRDVTEISDNVKRIVEKIDTYVTKPIMMTKSIIEFVRPFIDTAESTFTKTKTRRKKK
jgi:hypothetical protein